MLKTISSITNALGALNYKGTWDANANVPPLASGVGTKGDYYVVGTAGSTTLDGISNWGVGDWAAFNGSVWQRVEGGANLNGVDLSVSGTSTLSGLTASTALALNASKQIVSVTNTGTGDNVLATAPTLVGDVNLSTGNITQGTAAKGLNFTANTLSTGGTSQLFNVYEEGTFTGGTVTGVNTTGTPTLSNGKFTRIGNIVTVRATVSLTITASATLTYIACVAPFASVNRTSGSAFDNGNIKIGSASITAGTTLYAFFPVASGIVAGATEWDVNITYQV